jgi:hypothetical protein
VPVQVWTNAVDPVRVAPLALEGERWVQKRDPVSGRPLASGVTWAACRACGALEGAVAAPDVLR